MSAYTAVLEGGGLRGLALAGAVGAALDHGMAFDRVVGTSAGALVGSLLVAGFDSDDLRHAVADTTWPDMADVHPIAQVPGIGKHLAMIWRMGLHRGDQLGARWRELLAQRGITTFGDLPDGALRVVATDLSHGRGVVLPDHLPNYGIQPQSFPVWLAVRMSATVPFLFEPIRLQDELTGEHVYFADGAMAARFPAQLVDRGHDVIGFRLGSSSASHEHERVKGPISLAKAVIRAGITAREDLPRLCGRLDRVVTVTAAVDSLNFRLPSALAAHVFDEGYRQATEQLPAITSPSPIRYASSLRPRA